MTNTVRASIIFSSLLLVSFLSFADDTTIEYRVTDVAGDVGFIPKEGTEISPVVTGLTLDPGDRLVTGKTGRVEFATKAGTVMELKENSHLTVESFSGQVSKFFLKVGRLFGKFASAQTTQHRYNIQSPVTVAAVRGTELAMCVEENGETQAGVNEGTVSFESAEGEIVVEESQGIIVKPNEKPEHLKEIPPLVAKDLAWFPHIRNRVPRLREQWKDRPPLARLELRQRALRKRVQWRRPSRPNPKRLKRHP